MQIHPDRRIQRLREGLILNQTLDGRGEERERDNVSGEDHLRTYLKSAFDVDVNKPVLVDHYIQGKELEVDAICDGVNVFVPGIMELVERTGIHSGD